MRAAVAALLVVASVIGLAGCASGPERIPHTMAAQEAATVPGMPPDIRFWADDARSAFAALRGLHERSRRQDPPTLLALSGGGDKGAYGAGFLNGWTETGTRPQFTVVTGTSTGALIAPYAFLGPRYDPVLEDMFTEIDPSDVFERRGIVAGIFGTGLTSNAPLAGMIAKHVTPDLLRKIAREHAAGRRLLVATTNLDAERTMVWNMGRIAEVGTPRALDLFRKVLLASTSIPAVFPPALIEVEAGETTFRELHVDGGAVAEIFTLPPQVLTAPAGATRRGGEIVMIINNELEPSFEVVEARTIPIAERAFSTQIKASNQEGVLETYAFAERNGTVFRLTFIGNEFDAPRNEPFDQKYMRALFAYGLARGERAAFVDAPPFSR